MQAAFAGDAERLGLKDEQDITALVDKVRKEMWAERHEDNNHDHP